MNKGITILILLVILGAMGLVMYTHTREKQAVAPDPGAALHASDPAPQRENAAIEQNRFPHPLNAPQGMNVGLRPIEPPLTGTQSGSGASSTAGAPKPVTLTTGSDGKPAQPVAPSPVSSVPSLSSAKESGPQGSAAPPPGSAKSDAAPGAVKPAELPAKPVPPAPAASSPERQTGPAQSDVQRKTPDNSVSSPSAKSALGSPGLTPWTKPPQDTPAGKPASMTQPSALEAKSANKAEQQAQPAARAVEPTARTQTTPSSAQTISGKGAHSLKSISLVPAGDKMLLKIDSDNAFSCKTFALTEPDRLVIDLPGAWTGMKAPTVPKNYIIKNVRLGQQSTGPRLVLDLSAPLKGHKVSRYGSAVEIQVQ